MRTSARRYPAWVSCRGHPQRAFPTLRAGATASGGGAFAHSPRRGQPTAPDRCAASSGRSPGSPPAPAPPPPGTSLVGWVTGPDSPNDTIGRFAITGTDLGIMWDNGDPATIRCSWPSATPTAIAASAANNGGTTRCSAARTVLWPRHQRAEWRCLQQILRLTAVGAGPFQTDHQQHQVGADRRRESFRPPASPSGETNTSTSCPSRAGTPTARGRRTSRRSRCRPTTANTGVSTRIRPPARTGQRPGSPVRCGKRELPAGRVPQARARRPLPLLVRHTVRTRRLGICGARAPRLVPDLTQIRVLELRPTMPGFRAIRGLRRR